MRRSYLLNLITLTVLLLFSTVTASAQTEQMRGTVKMVGANGQQTPVAGATVDVYRTDMKADYHTKSDKKGDWVFAGLPFVGTYTVTISAPGASPMTKAGVKARANTPIDAVLTPGSGKKLTEAEALAAGKGEGAATSGAAASGESAGDKAKAAEDIAKKNAEITATNNKIENANKVIGDSFKAGNAALMAGNEADRANKHDEAMKLYGDAIQQYDTGVAADPEHPGIASLLTNKSAALRSRGVDRYNAAIVAPDGTTKTAGLETAKADFTAAAEAANRAVEMIKKQTPATDPAEQKQQATNKYFALNARAEAMRLFVPKVDPGKADEVISAYQEYMAAEPDAAKKSRAQMDMAQMLLDAGAADKAAAEFQKIVAEKPDDPDANLGLGLALFSSGDKAKYQEAANYLQKFVNTAPDTHKFKNDAKAVLQELKNAENVTPEKTTTKPGQRKRP